MLFDMPLERLRAYRPEPEEPADFDSFWEKTLDVTFRSTVFAAYHRYAGPAEIEVIAYNGHEGGADYDLPRKTAALRGVFGR